MELSCADCYDQSVIACILQFFASQPQTECKRACLVKKWLCLVRLSILYDHFIKKDINIIGGN
jgi:hypothetical protein